MSISLPTYTRRETPLLGRRHRGWVIFTTGLRRQGGRVAAILPIAIGTLLTTVGALFTLFLAPLLLPPGTPIDLSFFYGPTANPTMLFFVTLLAATVGAGLIADDVHSNALTLYLSRPISAADYLTAKGAVLGTLMTFLTVLPFLITALLAGLLGLVPWDVAGAAAGRAVLLGLLYGAFYTAVPLLLSALTPRRAYAAAGVFAVTFGLGIPAAILAGATGENAILYLSPWEAFLAVARAAYGAPAGPIDWPGGLAVLVGATVLAALVTYLRMRSMEVVAG